MARTQNLKVVISGDASQLSRAFGRAEKDSGHLEGRIGKHSSAIGKHLGTMAKVGSVALGGALVLGVKQSIAAFQEHEKVAAQTAAVLKSTGGAANVSAKDIDGLATSISNKSGMDDEAVQSAENLLLTFTKVRNETGKGNDVFTQATSTVADMSTALGQDLKSSSIQVGKALNDPIKGITALSRVGVTFSKGQKDQIKALESSGQHLKAQKIILKELNREFGGSAKAAGSTFAGSINKAKVAVGNLGEVVGGKLAPFIAKGATWLAKFTQQMTSGTGQGGRFVRTLKHVWEEIQPVAKWAGTAAVNVAKFGANHTNVAKLAAGVLGVAVAFKGLQKLGVGSLLKGVGSVGKLASSTLGVQKVFVTNWEMMAGGGIGGKAGKGGIVSKVVNKAAPVAAAVSKVATVAGVAWAIFGDGGKWARKVGTDAGHALGEVLGTNRHKAWIDLNLDKKEYDAAIARVKGTKLEPKVMAILGKDEDAKSKIKALIKLGIPKKTAKVLADTHTATSSIDALGDLLRRLPKSKQVKVDVLGLSVARAGLDALRSAIDSVGQAAQNLGSNAATEALKVTGRASGGYIGGSGHGDIVPAMLEPGEFVMRKRVVSKFGPTFFASMNGGMGQAQARGYSSGGIVQRAKKLDGMHLPYLWGGGHGSSSSIDKRGEDCSGAVSYVLGVPPRVSGGFTSWGKPGLGKPWDTKVYANAEHVFMVVNGRGFGTSHENPGGGAGWLSYNSRPGFAIRHISDASSKGGSGNTQEKSERGKSSASSKAATAGSKLFSAIAKPFTGAISKASSEASSLGTAIEDADTSYGQVERAQGLTEENLGTPGGRAARLSELAALSDLKKKQLDREHKRAAALTRAISKIEALLKKARKARDKAHGAKRAKIIERMRKYEDRLVDLKAELKALGFAIKDTEIDIADLANESGEVANTPDDATEPDKLTQALSLVDLEERAGVISSTQAQAARVALLQAALGGSFGTLTETQKLQIMGDLLEAQKAGAAAIEANTSALADLQRSLDEQLNFAKSVLATENFQLTKSLADIVSGQIAGYGVAGLKLTAGSGALARY